MSRKSIETPPERRIDVAFERGAGAERDDRHRDAWRRCARSAARPRSIAETRPRPAAGCRCQVGGVAMLLAHRLRGDEPIAECGRQLADRRRNPALIAYWKSRIGHAVLLD